MDGQFDDVPTKQEGSFFMVKNSKSRFRKRDVDCAKSWSPVRRLCPD